MARGSPHVHGGAYLGRLSKARCTLAASGCGIVAAAHSPRKALMDNISLTALAREQLVLAKAASSGRSAHTVYGGHEHRLRQTVIGLAAGRRLDEHVSPGEATLYVIVGRVSIVAGEVVMSGAAGHFMIIPDGRHTLEAEEDSVVMLTTALAG